MYISWTVYTKANYPFLAAPAARLQRARGTQGAFPVWTRIECGLECGVFWKVWKRGVCRREEDTGRSKHIDRPGNAAAAALPTRGMAVHGAAPPLCLPPSLALPGLCRHHWHRGPHGHLDHRGCSQHCESHGRTLQNVQFCAGLYGGYTRPHPKTRSGIPVCSSVVYVKSLLSQGLWLGSSLECVVILATLQTRSDPSDAPRDAFARSAPALQRFCIAGNTGPLFPSFLHRCSILPEHVGFREPCCGTQAHCKSDYHGASTIALSPSHGHGNPLRTGILSQLFSWQDRCCP